MKKYLIYLLIVVLVITSGCSAPSEESSASESQITSSQDEPQEEYEEQAVESKITPIIRQDNSQNATIRDTDKVDQYVSHGNYWRDEFAYSTESLDFPIINIESNYANEINEEIKAMCYDIATPEGKMEGYNVNKTKIHPWFFFVNFGAYLNGDILSVIITQREGDGTTQKDSVLAVYNINIITGEKVTNNEILSYFNLTSDEVFRTLIETSAKAVNYMFDNLDRATAKIWKDKTREFNQESIINGYSNGKQVELFIYKDEKEYEERAVIATEFFVITPGLEGEAYSAVCTTDSEVLSLENICNFALPETSGLNCEDIAALSEKLAEKSGKKAGTSLNQNNATDFYMSDEAIETEVSSISENLNTILNEFYSEKDRPSCVTKESFTLLSATKGEYDYDCNIMALYNKGELLYMYMDSQPAYRGYFKDGKLIRLIEIQDINKPNETKVYNLSSDSKYIEFEEELLRKSMFITLRYLE